MKPSRPSGGVSRDRVILAGARAFDDAEWEFVQERGLRTVRIADLADPTALTAAVRATDGTSVYIHVDLDVLDPAVLGAVALPVPFGLSLEQLTGVSQPTLSQQLGILRREGLVSTRREGKFIWYQLADARALQLMQAVHQLFCQTGENT